MDPVTHILASVALARAGLDRTTRLATPMLVVSGLAADVDWLSYTGGACTFLRLHRALAHSLLGSAILVLVIATGFWLSGRARGKDSLHFARVLVVCAAGAALHLLLDLCNSNPVQLLCPFHLHGYAWDLLAPLDLWVLVFLLAGLLLPGLFGLVSEEIGERKKKRGPKKGPIAALALVALYVGGRGVLHARAIDLLLSHEYRRAVPTAAGAFPSPASPLAWRSVVVTENALDELELFLGPGDSFDPDHSVTHYKPEPSPLLDAGEHTETAQRFLESARFPLANIERLENGYRFELRDMRFSEAHEFFSVVAVVDLDRQLHVTRQEFVFARSLK